MDNKLFSKKTQGKLIKQCLKFEARVKGRKKRVYEYCRQFIERNEWVVRYSSETEIEAFLVRYQGWGKEFRWKVPLELITAKLGKKPDKELYGHPERFSIHFLSRGILYGEFDWREEFEEEVYWRGELLSHVKSPGQGVQSPGQIWTLGINLTGLNLHTKPLRCDRTNYSHGLPFINRTYLQSVFGLFDRP